MNALITSRLSTIFSKLRVIAVNLPQAFSLLSVFSFRILLFGLIACLFLDFGHTDGVDGDDDDV